ncbi:MAG: hypothetical protein OEY01_16205 [Desulfobulbaceae bacterium]|nr:hypothetical protein [Desulfobulbaceae bacterium]
MKILFICDWDYALFWHPLAKKLKQSGFVDDCVALVVGKIYFDRLHDTNDGVFDKIYLLQDGIEQVPQHIHNLETRVSEIEQRYSKDTLWHFVWADRSWVRCSYEEIKKRIVCCFDYFESLYSSESPDLILTHGYSSMPHIISHAVACKQDIKIFRHLSMRLGERFILSDNAMENESWISEYFTGVRSIRDSTYKKVSDFLREFRNCGVSPGYSSMKKKRNRLTWGHVYRFIRYAYRYWIRRSFKNEHSKPNPLTRLWLDVNWRIRRTILSNSALWDRFDSEEKYVYFPLHVQPEASTMLLAPYYLDQLSVLENISKSLPIGYRLVVKEHPSMLGRRAFGYYDRIKALSNTRLVFPFTDGFKIIQNSSAIVTITGTTGLEGLLYKKPVILLGSAYYRFCPLVTNASEVAPTQWPKLFAGVLNNYEHDEEILIKFLGAVFERSFEGVYVEPLAALEKILASDNLDKYVEQVKYLFGKMQSKSFSGIAVDDLG